MTRNKIDAVNKRLVRGYVTYEGGVYRFYENDTNELLHCSKETPEDDTSHAKFLYYWMQCTIDDALEDKYGGKIK